MSRNVLRIGFPALGLVALLVTGALAEDRDDKYVSREEYEKLKEQFEAMKVELEALKKARAAPALQTQQAIERLEGELEAVKQRDRMIEQMQGVMQDLKDLTEHSLPGTSKFLVTGYGTAGFTDREDESSTFSAGLNPIFLWKLGDNILFESELEVEIEKEEVGEAETEVGLEYANVSVILNDYITVGAGKFLTPFGIFSERLHPTWINKLPDFPLPYKPDRITPMSSVGAFVRGGVPLDSTKFNYAFYVSNGPTLITEAPDKAGSLDFKDFEDLNNSKAVGGRVGFLPIRGAEVGYSFQVARTDPEGFGQDVDVLLQAVDVSYVRYVDALSGIIDLRMEWIWSDVDDAVFDADGSLGFGPLTFDNDRHGGWVQAAYRPSGSSNKIIKNLEGVVRWDFLELPNGAPEELEQHQRWTWGLNYWFYPSSVLKFGYQLDDRDGEDDQDAFFIQAAIGF